MIQITTSVMVKRCLLTLIFCPMLAFLFWASGVLSESRALLLYTAALVAGLVVGLLIPPLGQGAPTRFSKKAAPALPTIILFGTALGSAIAHQRGVPLATYSLLGTSWMATYAPNSVFAWVQRRRHGDLVEPISILRKRRYEDSDGVDSRTRR